MIMSSRRDRKDHHWIQSTYDSEACFHW